MTSRVHNGDSLEGDLDVFHARLAAKGWYVHPKAPRGKTIGKKPPDYLLGSPTGRFFQFEAKSVKGSAWGINLLDAHQYAALHAFTGTAGIYLRLDTGDVWLPWSVVQPVWRAWYGSPKGANGKRKGVYLDASHGRRVSGMDWTGVA